MRRAAITSAIRSRGGWAGDGVLSRPGKNLRDLSRNPRCDVAVQISSSAPDQIRKDQSKGERPGGVASMIWQRWRRSCRQTGPPGLSCAGLDPPNPFLSVSTYRLTTGGSSSHVSERDPALARKLSVDWNRQRTQMGQETVERKQKGLPRTLVISVLLMSRTYFNARAMPEKIRAKLTSLRNCSSFSFWNTCKPR